MRRREMAGRAPATIGRSREIPQTAIASGLAPDAIAYCAARRNGGGPFLLVPALGRRFGENCLWKDAGAEALAGESTRQPSAESEGCLVWPSGAEAQCRDPIWDRHHGREGSLDEQSGAKKVGTQDGGTA
jgi:hypothetical protein